MLTLRLWGRVLIYVGRSGASCARVWHTPTPKPRDVTVKQRSFYCCGLLKEVLRKLTRFSADVRGPDNNVDAT